MQIHPPPHLPLDSALIANLELDPAAFDLQVFTPLLQGGVVMRLAQGIAVGGFLGLTLGLAADFVEQNISTIFLNGKPVDSLEARLRPGDTLALSAAMPGLVGATLRRGGAVATLRSNISHREEEPLEEEALEGFILVKLFNTLIAALGPLLLKRGVLVRRDILKDILQDPEVWRSCPQVKVTGGEAVSPRVAGLPGPEGEIWIDLKIGRAGAG
jgi:hypothetical protein